MFTVKVLLEEIYILMTRDSKVALPLRIVDCGDGTGEIVRSWDHAWIACDLKNIITVNERR